MEKITFELSWGTVFKFWLLIASLYAFYLLREVLLWMVFALVISILFEPLIEALQKRKMPRVLAGTLVYLAVFSAFALLIYLFVPLLILETSQFSENFSEYFERASPLLRALGIETLGNLESLVDLAGQNLARIGQTFFSSLFSLFGGLMTTLFVIFLAFFLSLEERAIERTIFLLFPREYEDFALEIWKKCQKKVSGWFLTRVLSSLFVGGAVYLSLLILGVDYPFSLGIFAAVSNLVPLVGPFVAGLLIFLIVFPASLIKAGFAVAAFALIQQIEAIVVTPILTKKFIDLSPALVMISLAVGSILGGAWGAFLGIPVLGIFFEFLRDFLKKKKQTDAEN
jgi:predicted PurR-regulated permease PerM